MGEQWPDCSQELIEVVQCRRKAIKQESESIILIVILTLLCGKGKFHSFSRPHFFSAGKKKWLEKVSSKMPFIS